MCRIQCASFSGKGRGSVSTFPNCKSCLDALLRGWAVFWMLVVPFIHIHPETDRHHGEAGHLHGGTIHTVFSRDLDDEFDIHYDTREGHKHSTPNRVTFTGQPARTSQFSELGFSFLSGSTDRKLPKPLFLHGLITQSSAIHVVTPPASIGIDTVLLSPHTVFTRHISSRAPPSLLV